jgi:glycosyltransferase involved in cell wall biosynthesis
MSRHSVILTCFNGQQFIAEAIRSVLTQLGTDDELVVVDDASTDDSMLQVKSISDTRIRIYSKSLNGGIAAARNEALSMVRGDFISFIDHDDRWAKGRMKDFEGLINVNKDAEVVHGMVEHFYEKPELADKYNLPHTQSAVLPGSVTLSKDLIHRIGYFDESLTCGEFVDFMARAKMVSNQWVASDQIYLERRIHGNNYTLQHTNDSTGYFSVVRAHLLRIGKPPNCDSND